MSLQTEYMPFATPEGLTLLDKPKVSPTGRYVFFYGRHYQRGHTCYDVAVCHMATRRVTRRHYNTVTSTVPDVTDDHCKGEALAYWTHITQSLQSLEATHDTDR